MLSKDEVIGYRISELVNEIEELEEEIEVKQMALNQKQGELEILKEVQSKGVIVADYGRTNSKALLEDSLRRLFEKNQRAMTMNEIIAGLGEYGYVWTRYHTAYALLRNRLNATGTRGYYEYV